MIGHVIMEIEADEMRAAVTYYLNKDVFDANAIRVRHRAIVTDVRQRSNGNFVVEFDGLVSHEAPAGKADTESESE